MKKGKKLPATEQIGRGVSEGRENACFHSGTNPRAFAYLGAHPQANGHILFRVYAPNAETASVCGDFNEWDPERHPMQRLSDGVWEISIPSDTVGVGDLYKYCITRGGERIYKSDPYAFASQKPPDSASVICDLDSYAWRDTGWMRYRRDRFTRKNAVRQPINVYELHAGSWKRHGDGSLYSYRDLAADLLPYVKQMGYTHVELMPIAEHPNDDSWGYQVCGYYAPTARYGAPEDLMAFVDTMHEGGIGVILDWVPAHFPKDEHGLARFDGTPLYEYNDPSRAATSWETLYFDIGRPEVQSFLISCAVFWAEKYHVDGLRTDAVASMLYLDFDRREGEWEPNMLGDNRNLDAIAFFQKLNSRMSAEFPDVMMIAEDSSIFPHVTSFDGGGLGFTFKWSLGWMNDSLAYHATDPLWRNYSHNKLTFPMSYAFDEHFFLPLSHDEVVHGKRSILDRAAGEYEQKFADTRTYLTYQMTHPGKKLLFMGGEIGVFREWDHREPVEWFLLEYDMHARLQLFVSELNHFYLDHSSLWERDDGWEGFAWLDADNAAESVYTYCRRDGRGEELTVILNFLPVARKDFEIQVASPGIYEEVFNSDNARYGGSGMTNGGRLKSFSREEPGSHGGPRLRLLLPAMSAVILRCCKKTR